MKSADFEVIKNDLLYLYSHVHSYAPKFVGNVLLPLGEPGNLFVGRKIDVIKQEGYFQQFCALLENESYLISLSDESLICAFFFFDAEGQLLSSSISFLPNLTSDTLFGEMVGQAFNGEFYLRIDYDPAAFSPDVHSKAHLHATLNRMGVRFPVRRPVLISEFLYFVLKNIYSFDSSPLLSHIREIDNVFPCTLSESELASFFLSV